MIAWQSVPARWLFPIAAGSRAANRCRRIRSFRATGRSEGGVDSSPLVLAVFRPNAIVSSRPHPPWESPFRVRTAPKAQIRPESLRSPDHGAESASDAGSGRLWRAISPSWRIHRRGRGEGRAAHTLQTLRFLDRGAAVDHRDPRRPEVDQSECPGSRRGPQDPPQSDPSRPGREDGAVRRLGHAAALRFAARGAPCGAPVGRHVRRLPHDRGRSARRARAGPFCAICWPTTSPS